MITSLVTEQKVAAFHPILHVWLNCRYWSTEFVKVTPESGGWLDWDAELTQGLVLCDEIYEQVKSDEAGFEKIRTMKVPQGGTS